MILQGHFLDPKNFAGFTQVYTVLPPDVGSEETKNFPACPCEVCGKNRSFAEKIGTLAEKSGIDTSTMLVTGSRTSSTLSLSRTMSKRRPKAAQLILDQHKLKQSPTGTVESIQ
jgi:hypothetical protein